MESLRVGFIGAGGIAQRHLGVIETFADVEVAGIADPEPERARATAARVGAQAFGSHEEMLAALELDALWICVPPFAHGASGARGDRAGPAVPGREADLARRRAGPRDRRRRAPRRPHHRGRLSLALSRHSRRGEAPARRQSGASDVGPLARSDSATGLVAARGPLRRPDRRAGDPHHRPRPLSRRRGDRGLRPGGAARSARFPWPRCADRLDSDPALRLGRHSHLVGHLRPALEPPCRAPRLRRRAGARADRPRPDGRRRSRPTGARRRGRPGLAPRPRLRRRRQRAARTASVPLTPRRCRPTSWRSPSPNPCAPARP